MRETGAVPNAFVRERGSLSRPLGMGSKYRAARTRRGRGRAPRTPTTTARGSGRWRGRGPGATLEHTVLPCEDRPMTSRGHERVAGPRGRRLGLERGMILSPRATGLASWLRHDRDPGRGARPAASSPSPVGGPAPSLVQRSPLVSSCRPSPASTSHGPGRGTTRSRGPGRHGGGREVLAEEPDGEDVLAAHPSIRAVLETEAEYVLGSGPARQGARPRADSRWVIDGWEREGRSSLPGDSRGVLEAWARN